MSQRQVLHCSFCGKSQHDVLRLIAGPDCFICDECVDICVDIMADAKAQKARWDAMPAWAKAMLR